MAVITSGKTFANGEQLSADKLNQVITSATFNQSDAVDNSTMTIVGGAMAVAENGIVTAKIADSSSKTTGVTFAKMQHISTAKVLGRATADEGDIEEAFDFKDEDDMSSDSATALASQQSIKAYVETSKTSAFTPTSYTGGETTTLPNGLIMKFGTVTVSGDTNTAVNFGAAFNATVSAQLTIEENTTTDRFPLKVSSLSTSALTIRNTQSDSLTAHWLAFGR